MPPPDREAQFKRIARLRKAEFIENKNLVEHLIDDNNRRFDEIKAEVAALRDDIRRGSSGNPVERGVGEESPESFAERSAVHDLDHDTETRDGSAVGVHTVTRGKHLISERKTGPSKRARLNAAGKASRRSSTEGLYLGPSDQEQLEMNAAAYSENMGHNLPRLELSNRSPLGIPPSNIPEIDAKILTQTVGRNFMATTYGGHPEDMRVYIEDLEQQIHSWRESYLYLSTMHHPHLPHRPGAPGLYITAAGSFEDPSAWTGRHQLSVCLQPDRWLYMGQYEFVEAAPLTAMEWKCQRDDVLDAWINHFIASRSAKDGFEGLRAKVYLSDIMDGKPPMDKVKSLKTHIDHTKLSLSKEALRALHNGWVTLKVWELRFVRYDEDFQLDIIKQKQK
ncbi:hypothetical protein EW146_g2424 [Bondarzewia mesenterica]|uniref:DUF6697 domain-containing protein n=1 Tax=Bondarzewia mesenterica TaxID=1095465 RepID=A0A4S4M0Y6_9AGAM|nr:hypothetical protein EW146_g2424 [Bondarzewia mesenterica]